MKQHRLFFDLINIISNKKNCQKDFNPKSTDPFFQNEIQNVLSELFFATLPVPSRAFGIMINSVLLRLTFTSMLVFLFVVGNIIRHSAVNVVLVFSMFNKHFVNFLLILNFVINYPKVIFLFVYAERIDKGCSHLF